MSQESARDKSRPGLARSNAILRPAAPGHSGSVSTRLSDSDSRLEVQVAAAPAGAVLSRTGRARSDSTLKQFIKAGGLLTTRAVRDLNILVLEFFEDFSEDWSPIPTLLRPANCRELYTVLKPRCKVNSTPPLQEWKRSTLGEQTLLSIIVYFNCQ